VIWLAVHPVVAASSGSANDITPGVLGFLVIAAMGAALFLLLRSMNKHLRRVREVRDAGLPPGADLGGITARSPVRTASGPRTGTRSAAGNTAGTAADSAADITDGCTGTDAWTDAADGTGGG
jgi:hypothetical protein